MELYGKIMKLYGKVMELYGNIMGLYWNVMGVDWNVMEFYWNDSLYFVFLLGRTHEKVLWCNDSYSNTTYIIIGLF